MRALLVLLLIAGLFLPLALLADDATLPDGRRLTGTLCWQENRPRFAAGDRTFVLTELQQIRCQTPETPPLRAGVVHRVVLRDGQRLTGQLLGLDADAVKIQTVWAEKPLTLPRAWVAEISHLPGFVTFFDDDFEDGLKAWKLTGNPSVSDKEQTSGEHSLLLDRAGQVAVYVLPEEREAGRVGINFLDGSTKDAGRWALEAEFTAPEGPRLVRVLLASDSATYSTTAADIDENAVKRSPGWHRLTLEFAADRLWVLVDDAVIAVSKERGPGGPLRAIRLQCAALADKQVSGQMAFDDFSLARTVESLHRPPGEAGRDEVWSLSGDQLFGSILRADRRSVEFQNRTDKRTLPWSGIRALHLKSTAPALRTTDGEHVRLQLNAGIGRVSDEVAGVLRGLDERRLTLQHAAGEVVIARDRWRQLRGTFHGRRLELDNDRHHLGREIIAAWPVPRPEGLRLQTKFKLDAVPADPHLAVEVTYLKGPGDGKAIAEALQRGGLRTVVVVNGKEVDYLNRLVEHSAAEPRRLRMALPKEALRTGENVIELQQSADRDTGRYEECILSAIALELPN